MNWAPIVLVFAITAWGVLGALLGAAFFGSLRYLADLIALGTAPVRAGVLIFVRFGAAAVILYFVATQAGAVPLLVTTAGLIVARTALLRAETSP
jgi:N-ATPase, AtpR subunit